MHLVGFIIRILQILKEIMKGLPAGNIYAISVTEKVPGEKLHKDICHRS